MTKRITKAELEKANAALTKEHKKLKHLYEQTCMKLEKAKDDLDELRHYNKHDMEPYIRRLEGELNEAEERFKARLLKEISSTKSMSVGEWVFLFSAVAVVAGAFWLISHLAG